MFCANCGAEVNQGAAVCLKCGFPIGGGTENDKPNTGFAVLGFLFPVVGLILYLIWHDSTPKKAKSCGRGALIGLCAEAAVTVGIICFVTVGVAGFNIADRNKAAVVQDEINAAIKPVYATYDGVGQVTARTRDLAAWSITVNPVLEYDMNDNMTQTELIGRRVQLIDFFKRYFSGKFAQELQPDSESMIKSEIQELLNTTVLDKARIRGVIFTRFEVFESIE